MNRKLDCSAEKRKTVERPDVAPGAAGVSRRDFLKAAGASSITIPALAMNCARAEEIPAEANERIQLGCIGIGGMGNGHLGRCLRRASLQVVAVCDVDGNRLHAARNRVQNAYAEDVKSGTYTGCAAYTDFRDLLARDDIDAVVVATPDHWHAIISIEAAKAGKDIYCEKPLTLTIGEARDIIRAVRRYGRIFQTGSQQRSGYGGRFRKVCELIRSGRIGKLLTAHVSVGGPSRDCYLPPEPTPDWMNWDMWLGPAPFRPYNAKIHPARWRGYRDYSGGGMTDWGAHHFDVVQWALDMDRSGPAEIIPPDGKDHKQLTYVYGSGVRVFHGGYTGPGGNGITFTGTDGRIEVNRSHLRTDPPSIAREPLGPRDVHLPVSHDHMGNWIDCIRRRNRPVCDVSIGAHSVTVCHLGNIAYWLKRPLRWDPANWKFVNDDAADRWIDRPRRAPWGLPA